MKIKPTPTQIQIIEYLVKNHDKEVFQKDLEDVLNLRRNWLVCFVKSSSQSM